jgi:hypothetical protein
VAGLFVLLVVGFFIYAQISNASQGKQHPVANVKCEGSEMLATHYHAHLVILKPDGQPVTIPANVGIQATCLYWIHTHDDSGIIHIEAPADQKDHKFTLGDFFDVWGQPLDSKQLATLSVGSGQKITAFVDGKAWDGDLRAIPLKPHGQITLELTPPVVQPTPFEFPQGL